MPTSNLMWTALRFKIQNALNRQQAHITLVQPINSVQSSDINNTEADHIKTYRVIWRLIDMLANVVGFSAHKETVINARLAFTISLMTIAYIASVYTMILDWHSIPLLLEVVCIIGVLLPATFKVKIILKDMKYLISMNKFFEEVLLNQPNWRRGNHLAMEMKNAMNKVKMFLVVSVVSLVVFALYPIHAYITDNRLEPLIRLEYPFLDSTVLKDYLIGQTVGVLIALMGVTGSTAFDLANFMLLLQYRSLVTVLILDLEDYDEILMKKGANSHLYLDSFTKNICKKYSDINRYMQCFERTFASIYCYSICVQYPSLICVVFAVIENGWISGYGFGLFCFVQLYVQCLLGTFTDIQNERLSQAFYLTHWYKYPVKVQKNFLLLMHASSFNAVELTIGPFAPLNVKTGVMMTKGIFSYYTAMTALV